MFNVGKFVAGLLLTGLASLPAIFVTRMKAYKSLSKMWRYLIGGALIAIPAVVLYSAVVSSFKDGKGDKMVDREVRVGTDSSGNPVTTDVKQMKAENKVLRMQDQQNRLLTRGLRPRDRREAQRAAAYERYALMNAA